MNVKIKALRSSQSHDLWQQLRIPLLVITFVSVVSLVSKTVLAPIKTSQEFTRFAFPSTVPLPGWQLSETRPLTLQATKHFKEKVAILGGRYYQYTQRSRPPLDIEMRYVVNPPGNVKRLVRKYTPIDPPNALLQERQQVGVGFHSLFAYQGRAYLSACINPRGGSTVTERQFVQNQITYDIQFERLLPVLLGQESLQDKRCLWAHLSMLFKDSSPEPTYQTLEKAWVSWYQWWKPKFPKF